MSPRHTVKLTAHFERDLVAIEAFLVQARASGDALDLATFEALAKPTIDGPVRQFSSVEPGLFEHIDGLYSGLPRPGKKGEAA